MPDTDTVVVPAASVPDATVLGSTPASTPAIPTPAQDWYTGLPEGLRANPALQPFQSKPVTTLAESYVSTKQMVGNAIQLPNPTATAEDQAKSMAAVYTKLGRPASAKEYKYELPKSVEGVQLNEADLVPFHELAFKLGLNNEQAKQLVEFDNARFQGAGIDQRQAYEQTIEVLVNGDEKAGFKGWGAATDRYLGLAKRVVETMFPKGTMEELDKSGMSNNPAFIRGLAAIGKNMMEEGVVLGEDVTTGTRSPEAELQAIMSDEKHPYWLKNHPDHQQAVQRVFGLNQVIHGAV